MKGGHLRLQPDGYSRVGDLPENEPNPAQRNITFRRHRLPSHIAERLKDISSVIETRKNSRSGLPGLGMAPSGRRPSESRQSVSIRSTKPT
jgi:hypothetical protein